MPSAEPAAPPHADPAAGPAAGPMPKWVPPFLGLMLAVALALRLSQWMKPIADLFEPYFLTDDGYYAFSYARELARGHPYQSAAGFPGNGFQPLYVFLIAPFFWISPGDPDLPVRLALLFSIVLSAGTCALLLFWGARIWGWGAGAVAAALWALSPTAVIHSLNGLETALHLFCISLLGAFWPWFRARPLRLGVMAGLCVLARVDTSLAVPILFLLALFQERRRDLSAAASPGAAPLLRREDAMRAARLAAGFAVAVGPYCVSSWLATGHLSPMSGRGMRNLSLYFAFAEPDRMLPLSLIKENIAAAWRAARDELSLHLFFAAMWADGARLPPAVWIVFGAFGAGLFALARPWRIVRSPAFALGALLIVLWVAAYTGYVGGAWFYPRYFHPGLVLLTLGVAAALASIPLPANRAARLVPLAIFLALAAASYRVLEHKAEAGRFFFSLDALPRINKLLELGPVGMFQSGVIAYYTDGRVLNLDGVANEGALNALAEGTMDRYIAEQKVARVVDWDWIEPPLFRARSDRSRMYLKLLERTRFFCTWEPIPIPNPARIAELRASVPGGLVLLPHDPVFHPHAGWGDPRLEGEDLFCWNASIEPKIAFAAPRKPGRYTIRINFDRPHPWPAGTAEIGVLWPGEGAVRKTKVGAGPFTLETKIDLARPGAQIFIQLYIPSGEPPAEYRQLPSDVRAGVRFFKLELIPEPSA